MPSKSKLVFTNKDTRTFVQNNGIGTVFNLYDCQALTEWSRDYGETTYVKVKSADEYGKKTTKAVISGDPGNPTFTVVAYTPEDADWLLGLECPVDFQVHYGRCSSPSDLTNYTKIRHFYRASPTSEGESGVDFIGDEEYAGIQQSVSFSSEDVITILKVQPERKRSGVTEAQAFNDIAFLAEGRCEGDCGKEVGDCEWGVAVADANYGSATANVWITKDSGATWTICAVDPFSANDANISSCVILPGEVAPRIIVFRGNVYGSYGARASISDDWGASWTEVDMGGHTNGSYINGAYKYGVGLIWAVGNGGHVYYSEDRGASWTLIADATTGTAEELWDIGSPPDNSNIVYVVGDNDTVIFSDDGGASWAATTTGPNDATGDNYTVDVDSEYKVWVGGSINAASECLWVTEDGGVTWTAVTFVGSTTASGVVRRFRHAPHAWRQHKVFIWGVNNGATQRYGPGTNFRFYRTLDGGGSWERKNLVTNNGLNGLSVCSINSAWAAGETYGGLGDIQHMNP